MCRKWVVMVVCLAGQGSLATVAQETPSAAPAVAAAAPGEQVRPEVPKIADEPRTIDPSQFMPKPLAALATVEFSEASLQEVVDWLRDEQKLVVILDDDALAEIKVLPGDPVRDRLDQQPVYLLLNRLSSLGLAWFFEDELLQITSHERAETRQTTVSHGVGDLLDAGYKADDLVAAITSTIAQDSWEEVGGPGAASMLGDVLFVRQTDQIQREVQSLLAALRNHGRRTFVLDPAQHLALREQLENNVSVAFRDTPLETAVRELAAMAQIDIRLDSAALRESDVRDRHPVSLTLADRKLKTVLQAMLSELELTWVLRDGVLWITTDVRAEEIAKTAVYDVRDLCRDQAESDALRDAIVAQTTPDWEDAGGAASLVFARPGTLVINAREALLTEVLDLLERYREALRKSKPRARPEEAGGNVTTVYYRMHAAMAEGLVDLLPKLVRPDSWRSDKHPDAPGEIFRVASKPDLAGPPSDSKNPTSERASERAVLIVKQTQAAHEEISEVISRVETGDGGRGLGGGLGGGGFGGGFFSSPSGVDRPGK